MFSFFKNRAEKKQKAAKRGISKPHVILPQGQTIVNRYKIIRLLGSGASGSVYAAHDYFKNNEVVALKLFPKDTLADSERKERMYREASFLRRLTHHNVIRFYEEISDQTYSGFAMEYVDGITLDKLTSSTCPLSIEEKILIIYQICCGIEAIHSVGLVHRDIKPENILMSSEGIWKIADFGIAHRPADPNKDLDETISYNGTEITHSFARRLTVQAGITGTLDYLSPEYIIDREVSIQGDIYSLGYLAYQLLKGEAPYDAEEPARLLFQKSTMDPEMLLITGFPNLGPIIAKCMARDTKDRYKDIKSVIIALIPYIKICLSRLEKTKYSKMSLIEQGFCVNAAKQLSTKLMRDTPSTRRKTPYPTCVPEKFDAEELLSADWHPPQPVSASFPLKSILLSWVGILVPALLICLFSTL